MNMHKSLLALVACGCVMVSGSLWAMTPEEQKAAQDQAVPTPLGQALLTSEQAVLNAIASGEIVTEGHILLAKQQVLDASDTSLGAGGYDISPNTARKILKVLGDAQQAQQAQGY
ncbi:MAG: hypothetical protein WCW33_01115 [Candidatus Babeliales bacterium]|jgi:hypothetical protein